MTLTPRSAFTSTSSAWPDKVGTGVLYLAFDADEFALVLADLDARNVALKDGWWGKALTIVEDPDSNQLYFARP